MSSLSSKRLEFQAAMGLVTEVGLLLVVGVLDAVGAPPTEDEAKAIFAAALRAIQGAPADVAAFKTKVQAVIVKEKL